MVDACPAVNGGRAVGAPRSHSKPPQCKQNQYNKLTSASSKVPIQGQMTEDMRKRRMPCSWFLRGAAIQRPAGGLQQGCWCSVTLHHIALQWRVACPVSSQTTPPQPPASSPRPKQAPTKPQPSPAPPLDDGQQVSAVGQAELAQVWQALGVL